MPGRPEEAEVRGGVSGTEDSATDEELGRVEHKAEVGRESDSNKQAFKITAYMLTTHRV